MGGPGSYLTGLAERYCVRSIPSNAHPGTHHVLSVSGVRCQPVLPTFRPRVVGAGPNECLSSNPLLEAQVLRGEFPTVGWFETASPLLSGPQHEQTKSPRGDQG